MSDNVYAHTPTQCAQEWQPFSQLSPFTMQTRRVDSSHVWRTGTNCYNERLHEILAMEIKNILIFPALVFCPLCFQSMPLAQFKKKKKLFFYRCSLYQSMSFALCLFDVFSPDKPNTSAHSGCSSALCFNIQQNSTILWSTHHIRLNSTIMYGWMEMGIEMSTSCSINWICICKWCFFSPPFLLCLLTFSQIIEKTNFP